MILEKNARMEMMLQETDATIVKGKMATSAITSLGKNPPAGNTHPVAMVSNNLPLMKPATTTTIKQGMAVIQAAESKRDGPALSTG